MILNTSKTVALTTLGCKVAQYETEAIAEAFEAEGFVILPFDSVADVYVINTCTVTLESDRKSRQMIRRAAKRNPNSLIMVTGCYAQTSSEEVASLPNVSYVCGNESKLQLPKRAMHLMESARKSGPFLERLDLGSTTFEAMSIKQAPRTRAYVKIEDGCECRCTYCAIPAARGKVRSKDPADVIEEVKFLAQNGTKEIVLTGIETASYGVDLQDVRLVDLLETLDREAFVPRIRLGSMTPEFFKEDTILRLASLKTLTPHFHLSVQSGSSSILRSMRRRYLAVHVEEAVHSLRSCIPHLELTADFIVGFPGETDDDFEDTFRLVENAAFLDLHVFTYSKRKNTPASDFPNQVPESVKRERSRRLIALGETLRRKRLGKALEQYSELSVLFEERDGDFYIGHTASFIPVAVRSKDELHGKILSVRPEASDGTRILGTQLKY